MNREERLEHIARELAELTAEERDIKALRDDAKEEFFRLLRDRHKHSVLPVRTVEVPDEFFHSTGLSYDEFVESRFPGWLVEHVEKNIAMHRTVFVLKRDPEYLTDAVDITTDEGTLRVSKVVAEYTPEVDWESLRREDEKLFDKLAQPQLVYNVNEEALERLMEEEPHELAKLQRHMKVRKPSLKVTSRKVKDESV